MIIDFHFHLARRNELYKDVYQFCEKVWQKEGISFLDIVNGDIDEYLKSQGVDFAVGLAEISPITTGIIDNEEVVEICKKNKRLIPGGNINPYLVRSVKEEAKRLYKMGIRVIKLYPTYQYFYPNESFLYPFYEVAQELEIPLMFHTGSSVFKGARIKYGDPIYLDDVAVDFPDLKILLVHGGRGFFYDRAFFLSKLHKNIYLEISGLPPENLLKYFPDLEKISDKVIFGSDFPSTGHPKNNIEKIKNLPISSESKKKILGENAKKILRLNGGKKV
jgi:predicted TIM-barrel fold metal-dependent hydrolase